MGNNLNVFSKLGVGTTITMEVLCLNRLRNENKSSKHS